MIAVAESFRCIPLSSVIVGYSPIRATAMFPYMTPGPDFIKI